MSASSRMDPLLAKVDVGLIRNDGKGRVRICERNNYVDSKVFGEGGGGHAPDTGAEIPLQPVVKALESGCHPEAGGG
ncbi:hypothetical protein BTVI_03873 [Pitangus sulphuratus]|nr:hypothetical protein BTVI_03873 [Pitangus sulphuratus]